MLTAYYFRQHMYTLVPRYVREDMAWLADVGTDAIAVALLEQDLWASKSNVAIIAEEADRVGIKLLAVPSRWGGLIAGAPKVPSVFTCMHEETWVRNRDGRPHDTKVSGRISSIHHPATRQFMYESLETMLREFPIAGVIWDEVKVLVPDYSEAAKAALGDEPDFDAHREAIGLFFNDLCMHAKSVQAGLSTHLFLYAHMRDADIELFAKQPGIDYFGCDGRPWRNGDVGEDAEGMDAPLEKTLLGRGERFIEAARRHGRGTLALIENHAMAGRDCEVMDRRLAEVLALDVDHWLYYYYGRDCDDPERVMAVLARRLKQRGG